MLKPVLETALNHQINEEIFSSYLYMSAAAWCEARNLKGFAHWFKVQAQEEMLHALRFYAFVTTRGGRVILQAIAQPKSEWKSPLETFQDALAHEEHITGCIHSLVDLALVERDHAAHNFLQFFVAEQVEEEANANDLVQRLTMVGDSVPAIFMLDTELAARPAPITLPVVSA